MAPIVPLSFRLGTLGTLAGFQAHEFVLLLGSDTACCRVSLHEAYRRSCHWAFGPTSVDFHGGTLLSPAKPHKAEGGPKRGWAQGDFR